MPRKSNFEKLVKDATAEQLKNMTPEQTLKAYQATARELKARRDEFADAGKLDKFAKHWRAGMANPKNLTPSQQKAEIQRARAFLLGKPSTLSGWQEWHEEQRQILKKRFDLENLTDEQMDKYGEFMAAMQKEKGKDWGLDSAEAQKIAVEALTSGTDDLTQFMENFKYWSEDTANKMEKYKKVKELADKAGIHPLELADKAIDWTEDPDKLTERARQLAKGRATRRKKSAGLQRLKLPQIKKRR